jgi:hypothetical protein
MLLQPMAHFNVWPLGFGAIYALVLYVFVVPVYLTTGPWGFCVTNIYVHVLYLFCIIKI